VHTHADLTGTAGRVEQRDDGWHLWIDAPRGLGLDTLRERLRDAAGVGEGSSGAFSARTRHVEAIVRAGTHLADAAAQLRARQGELAAEDLRLAQDALGEITGRVSSDALLGRIFSSFCIGK
jgi:tRNA modification GTPase